MFGDVSTFYANNEMADQAPVKKVRVVVVVGWYLYLWFLVRALDIGLIKKPRQGQWLRIRPICLIKMKLFWHLMSTSRQLFRRCMAFSNSLFWVFCVHNHYQPATASNSQQSMPHHHNKFAVLSFCCTDSPTNPVFAPVSFRPRETKKQTRCAESKPSPARVPRRMLKNRRTTNPPLRNNFLHKIIVVIIM